MSVPVELRVVDRGDDAYLTEAWDLKERIRRREGVLKQRRGFFTRAYRRARVHLLVDEDGGLLGFAATRSDGYLLFLAVDPDYRGQGFGRRLVAAIVDEHDSVTAHVRRTNDAALAFYTDLGFEVSKRINNYYEDGGDAYYLRLGDPPSLSDRLRRYVGS